MNKDLEIIKKKYGENMSHLCRELFPTILEKEGELPRLLQDNFALSRNLSEDIKNNDYKFDFQSFVLNKYDNNKIGRLDVYETPEELMQKVGYHLYKCNTKEQIDYFKKYYAAGETICTFRDESRIIRNHIFFAVKDNADKLKRSDFTNPERQDEYGTSVISIQFTKGDTNVTSIKNRYNTTVENCDATFSNNLENIVRGLTSSFEKYYHLQINQNARYFNLDNYKKASDQRYYRYYNKVNDVYYCENNIIIDKDTVIRDYQVPERYIVMDNYIIDLTKKQINLYNSQEKDGFIENMGDLAKITVLRNKENNTKSIKFIKTNNEEIDVVLNKNNQIIKYKNENLKNAGDNFLRYSKELEEFIAPKLEKIGVNFLEKNRKLKNFSQPLLEEIPNNCLSYNDILETVNVESVKNIGDYFLNENRNLTKINLPNVRKIGNGFLEWNKKIETINIPQIENIGSNFLTLNSEIEINGSKNKLVLENLKTTGYNFLAANKSFTDVRLNKLEKVDHGFMSNNQLIDNFEADQLVEAKNSFLRDNKKLTKLSFPNLVEIGDEFLSENNSLLVLDIDNVEKVGNKFLQNNYSLKYLNANKLKDYGKCFLPYNTIAKINANDLNTKDKIYTFHVRKIKPSIDNIKTALKKIEILRKSHNGRIIYNNIDNNDTAKSLVDEIYTNTNKNDGKRQL